METLAISLQDGSVKQLPSQAMPAGQTALVLLGVAKLIKGKPWKGFGVLTRPGYGCARSWLRFEPCQAPAVVS